MEEIIPLKKENLQRASEILARAFEKDEFVLYIFEDKKEKFKKLAYLLKCALKFGLLYGEVYTTPNLEAVSIWYPPNEYRRPLWRMIRAGGLGIVMKLGLQVVSREMPVTNLRDEIRLKHVKEPHWYLYIIAVDPVHQGKGYASIILRAMIKRIEQEKLPIYLDTNTK